MEKIVASVILAAGQGTRMRSALPKVLHRLLGKPLIRYPLAVAEAVSQTQPVVVIGHNADQVQAELQGEAVFALQAQQLGTGHAVMQARPLLQGKADIIFVLYGDMPLLRPETASALVEHKLTSPGPISMLTVLAENPRGFGRILRHPDGTVKAIVEEAQATPEQLAIKELNVGVYCFDAAWLWQALDRIPLSPKGEYYLTDTVAMAVSDGLPVEAIVMEDISETVGINNRVHLAEAEAVMRDRINRRWMEAGVTIINPQTVLIGPDVQLQPDVIIDANSQIMGRSSVESSTVIGPNTTVIDSEVGNNCSLPNCQAIEAVIPGGTTLAPYSIIR